MMQELSLNILDVAENSIRAEASLIEILLAEEPARDSLTITISDNGRGMEQAQCERVLDPFFTTRTTRRVGLGLPFFKQAAELTGGGLTIESTPGQGTTVSAHFVRSSIDCAPIGDINETILTLVCGNPGLDFLYTRRFGDRAFQLDTREFRVILEGIPLNHPRVSQFIRSFLSDNTADLLAGQEI